MTTASLQAFAPEIVRAICGRTSCPEVGRTIGRLRLDADGVATWQAEAHCHEVDLPVVEPTPELIEQAEAGRPRRIRVR